jgi:hypothetical protein
VRQFDLLNVDSDSKAPAEESLELYLERMQIQLALVPSGLEKKKDHVISCHLCRKYSIMFQPGHENAEFNHFQRIKTHWMEQMQEAFQKERDKKLAILESEKQKTLKKKAEIEKAVQEAIERKLRELAQIKLKQESNEEKAEAAPELTVKERMRLWGSIEKEDKLRDQIRKSGDVKAEDLCPQILKRLEPIERQLKDRFFELKAKQIQDEMVNEVKEKMKASNQCSSALELNAVYPVFQGLKETKSSTTNAISESTKFAVCGTPNCKGAFCLLCEIPLLQAEFKDHECRSNEVSLLHSEVIKVLARALVRTCPCCSTSGIKDLACTQITCGNCGTKWCYVCQKPEAIWIEAGVNNERIFHRCPRFLESRYQDIVEEQRGYRTKLGAQKALDRFHLEEQRNAIEAFKKTQDPALWEKMIETYFPKGIIDELDNKQS